jgi:hypothetical protein
MYNANGPPRGSNVINDQSAYDIIYKDIIVDTSNISTGHPYSFVMDLGTKIDKIYKAELISATVHFSSSIASYNTIFVSLGNVLDVGTTYIVPNNNPNSSGPSNFFVQIPNSSTPLNYTNNIISLYLGPHMYESVSYYNPPVNNLKQLSVTVKDINGNILTAVSNVYFTLRVYYLQKRNNVTTFSTQIITE